MTIRAHGAADYLAALQALMPRGAVWPTDPDAVQTRVLRGLAQAFADHDAAAVGLLIGAFPGTVDALLTEWEATLGLPDPCEGTDQTLAQRRGQVLAKFADGGGQSVAYFLRIAARLGYSGVTIETYAPFRADIDGGDQPAYGDDWAHYWLVTVPGLRAFYFSADVSTAGEALLTVENDVIICVFDALKPAHTLAGFATA
ncbi:YmfQ family protein [Phenylobacterium sp.]|uniref:YmfQ family protein n=1 Tax=Phenylobacterium sp. TaxID=1871053 RepID=UPI0035B25E62